MSDGIDPYLVRKTTYSRPLTRTGKVFKTRQNHGYGYMGHHSKKARHKSIRQTSSNRRSGVKHHIRCELLEKDLPAPHWRLGNKALSWLTFTDTGNSFDSRNSFYVRKVNVAEHKLMDWECEICSFMNSGFLYVCEMCSASISIASDSLREEPELKYNSTNDWSCEACTHINTSVANICQLCETSRSFLSKLRSSLTSGEEIHEPHDSSSSRSGLSRTSSTVKCEVIDAKHEPPEICVPITRWTPGRTATTKRTKTIGRARFERVSRRYSKWNETQTNGTTIGSLTFAPRISDPTISKFMSPKRLASKFRGGRYVLRPHWNSHRLKRFKSRLVHSPGKVVIVFRHIETVGIWGRHDKPTEVVNDWLGSYHYDEFCPDWGKDKKSCVSVCLMIRRNYRCIATNPDDFLPCYLIPRFAQDQRWRSCEVVCRNLVGFAVGPNPNPKKKRTKGY